ncbi:flagellar biosynthesis protein FlhA [Desulforudis sp. 1088]|uniref:flagellar biosynthesis protein FlhA n=1 Tax=unclassified Candidatus Desulforudis TaxID=2635950 RepID=UPI003CE5A08C
MAESLLNPAGLRRNLDYLVAALIIGIVLLIVIPLPPFALDVLLIVSITSGLLVLLITLFTTDPLQFSVFPTLLLVLTLYRLALNISSTRLILGQAAAGNVIDAFGQVVVGGSYIVGFVVFLIITVIQFAVITNGAGRVAEVGARFTLDAMPGKQMAIDSDFNAGLITEEEARERRRRLQREADFFGAMDGASKFVKGDAIAGLIITFINIIGGFIMGVAVMGLSIGDALRTYTILTIGDGLVAQLPAVLVSTAAGVLVTRATSDASFGLEISKQLTRFPKVLMVASGILVAMGLFPGMPNLLFLTLGGGLGLISYNMVKTEQTRVEQQAVAAKRPAEPKPEPENVLKYFQVDPLEVEIGYNLVVLASEEQGGDLLQRVATVRRQSAQDLGIYVRPIRIRDNLQLKPNSYVFKLRGVEAAQGELMPGYYLAMSPGGGGSIRGIPTKEPTFGLPAWWITEKEREQAEAQGYTVVDCVTVLITHLSEFIKRQGWQLLGRQELQELLNVVKEKNAAVVEELVPNLLTLGEVQKVLQNLLKEGVPIRDLVGILEVLADGARVNRDVDFLTESVRQALARTISLQYADENKKLPAITLHPRLEQAITESIQLTSFGNYPLLEPQAAQRAAKAIVSAVEEAGRRGVVPVVLCSGRIRLPLRRFLDHHGVTVPVLALAEVSNLVELEVLGTVMWNED